jgi:predicted RND superfamily exporter protein
VTSNNTTSSGGVGFTGLLTILFIALKLTHVITWSWWWVLSPLWISAAATIVVLGLMFGIAFVATVREERKAARR